MNGKQSHKAWSIYVWYFLFCVHTSRASSQYKPEENVVGARGSNARSCQTSRHASVFVCVCVSLAVADCDFGYVHVCVCVWSDASNYVLLRAVHIFFLAVFSAGYEMWKGRNSFCAYQMCSAAAVHGSVGSYFDSLFSAPLSSPTNGCRSHLPCISFGQPRNMLFSLFPQPLRHSRAVEDNSDENWYAVRACTNWHLFSSWVMSRAIYPRKRDTCTHSFRLTNKIEIAIDVGCYARQIEAHIFISERMQTTDSYIRTHRKKQHVCSMCLVRRRFSLRSPTQ